MTELARRVAARVAALAPEARTLLLAVSGGPDSAALLRLLLESDYRIYRIYAAHLDHALRPESAADAAFARSLGERLGVEVHVERLDVAKIAQRKGWNLEDAARRLRYGYLARVAKRVGAEVIVTGHTLDDQAETVVMQLLRGASYLRGMAPRRGRIVRPLLGVSRQELLDYLAALKQDYRSDESNVDTRRTRAWLRHEVLPLLERRYPKVKHALARLAESQYAQAEHFDAIIKPLLQEDGLDLGALRTKDTATQRHAVAKLIAKAGLAPDWEHVERIRKRLGAAHPLRLSLPKNHHASLAYGRLRIEKPLHAAELMVTPAEFLPPEVDADKLKAFPDVVFRSRQPGDRIRLAGGTKKVSDLLIDLKVPREERERLKLLASGSEVLWVEGLAVDVRVKKPRDDPDITPDITDVTWMRLALRQAEEALKRDEVPVGAVVVKEGEVIASAANATESSHDPTAHAEILALRRAAKALGDWRLVGCTLYVTLEPCAMCYGGMLQAQLSRLVCGAPNLREGALGGVTDLRQASWKHEIDVRAGVLHREASRLLRTFFQGKRQEAGPD